MRPVEEIQSELAKLHKEFHKHIKLFNDLKNGEYKNDQAELFEKYGLLDFGNEE